MKKKPSKYEIRTQREFQKHLIKLAYFHYWKLQNNPEYIEFYNLVKEKKEKNEKKIIFLGDEREIDPDGRIQRRVKENPEDLFGNNTILYVYRRGKLITYLSEWGYLEKKFNLVFPINPHKKIDWGNFPNFKIFDDEIIEGFNLSKLYQPVSQINIDEYGQGGNEDFKSYYFGPILRVKIDLRYDKFEILSFLSKQIDLARLNRGIKKLNRDHLNKFHLYAQVWDLRKGQGKKSYREIGRILGKKISTVKSMFYRAFELIFNKPYDSDFFKNYKSMVYKESLRKYCDICEERKTCRDVCPDIISYIMQDWKEGNYREVQIGKSNIKIKSYLGYSK